MSELGFGSDILIWQAILLTVVSFLVGILGGFVGLALGTIRLPAMLLLGMPAPIAGGTNILVSGLACLTGSIRHLREGRVNLRIVLVMGIPAFIGAFIGGFLADDAPKGLLILLAGLLVFWQGVEFLIMARERKREGVTDANLFGGELSRLRRHIHPRPHVRRSRHRLGRGAARRRGRTHTRQHPPARPNPHPARRPAHRSRHQPLHRHAHRRVRWVGHVVEGEVDYALLVMMGAAAMIGSYYGAKLTAKCSSPISLLAMGLVLLVVGAILAVRGGIDVF